jgi:hypothetical protein
VFRPSQSDNLTFRGIKVKPVTFTPCSYSIDVALQTFAVGSAFYIEEQFQIIGKQ